MLDKLLSYLDYISNELDYKFVMFIAVICLGTVSIVFVMGAYTDLNIYLNKS